MIGIVDYNAGNITSVERALKHLGADFVLSKKPGDLVNCDKIIFPGVGDASFAMGELKKSGFDVFLKEWAKSGKRLMGICLGAQIVFDFSEEGNVNCLGLIPGKIRHFKDLWRENQVVEALETSESQKGHFESLNDRKNSVVEPVETLGLSKVETTDFSNNLKCPHMGWNDLTYTNGGSSLFYGVPEHSDFYFVHSYVICPEDKNVVKATCDYGIKVPSCIEKDNITVFQFHPEKSGEKGLRILKNFIEE